MTSPPGAFDVKEQEMGMFSATFSDQKDLNAVHILKNPTAADSGAMPVSHTRDDSSGSSINSVKNNAMTDAQPLDQARQNQFKLKWEKVQSRGLKAARPTEVANTKE